jgi:hypothetical protein
MSDGIGNDECCQVSERLSEKTDSESGIPHSVTVNYDLN